LTAFKFLHAADIHLDSPLRGLSRYEGVPAERVRLATREALCNLVDAATDEGVSFVVIAGDLYDGDWDHFGTGLFFCQAMGRLGEAGIEVYLLYGNHDADSVLTRRLPLPANVHAFGHRKAATFVHAATKAALHGRSYRDRDPGENLSAGYPAPLPGCFNIGVLHTALTGGRPPHAPYSPCTPDELAAKGYDYWALGHVHEHDVVARDPHIVFCGNLQGRNIREWGPKGAVLVSVADNEVVELRHLALDAVRWTRVEVDVSAAAANLEVQSAVRAALSAARDQVESRRSVMARVVLWGESELHGPLLQRQLTLREEVRALALGISEDIWIEKVVLATRPAPTKRPEGETLPDEIAALFNLGVADPDLKSALMTELAEFANRIPVDLGEDEGPLQAVRRGELDSILNEAAATLRVRLVGEAD